MPKNLIALLRYQTIDKCLRNTNRRYTLADLQKECALAINKAIGKTEEPSIATLRKDITTMRKGVLGYFAPIINVKSDSRKPGYYRYSDPQFFIHNFSSNDKEVEALEDSRAMSPYLAPKENQSKENVPSSSSKPKKNNFQKIGWKIDPQVDAAIFERLQNGMNDFYKKKKKKNDDEEFNF